jgi:hypothetical protein
VRITLVVADAEGQEWQVESYLPPSAITDDFDDDSRRRAVENGSGFVFWRDFPESWSEALRKRCLLTGVADAMDSRSYVDVRIGERTYELRMKYQEAVIDLGVLGPELVARVRGLRREIYEGEGASQELDDFVELPPFGWLLPGSLLLCFAEPRRHQSTLEEALEATEPEDCEPSRATRLETRGAPQPSVVFRPSRAGETQ